jgi:hypothetical protein
LPEIGGSLQFGSNLLQLPISRGREQLGCSKEATDRRASRKDLKADQKIIVIPVFAGPRLGGVQQPW